MNKGQNEGTGQFRNKPLRRGGCSAFGHSCFGGHGKRSEAPQVPPLNNYPPRPLPSELIREWVKIFAKSYNEPLQ